MLFKAPSETSSGTRFQRGKLSSKNSLRVLRKGRLTFMCFVQTRLKLPRIWAGGRDVRSASAVPRNCLELEEAVIFV